MGTGQEAKPWQKSMCLDIEQPCETIYRDPNTLTYLPGKFLLLPCDTIFQNLNSIHFHVFAGTG